MRLMSICATAMHAANTAVMAPTHATTVNAAVLPGTDTVLGSNSGNTRAIRNTPAATIVAAWINALTGVGPSIASGSQTCSGTWPDLPAAPQKISSEIPVEAAIPKDVLCATNRVRDEYSRQPAP